MTHKEKHQNEKPVGTSTLDKFVAVKSTHISAFDKDKLTESAAKFVSKDLRPLGVVEGEGLIDFAHSLWNLGAKYGHASKEDVSKSIPSANSVRNKIRNDAKVKKDVMKSILSQVCERSPFLAVTCDVWQDNYRRISYLGVTIHFSVNGKLCDQLLAVKPLDWRRKKDHEYIKQAARIILEEKNIPFDPVKVIFITDRGSNMKKAFKDFERLNCFPHFVNNIVKEACKIDRIKTLIENCSDLVRYLKISGHNNEFQKTMKSAVPTRFNSVLEMIQSIIENWSKVNEILTRENETHRLLGIDCQLMIQIKEFLQPFKHWSVFAERSKQPSLYIVWIAIDSIIKYCAIKDNDEHLITLMKVKCICYIEKSFVLHKLHRIATLLNPNFKCLKFATSSLFLTTVAELREMLNKLPDPETPSNRRTSTSSSASSLESEISSYCNETFSEDEVDAYIRIKFPVDLTINPIDWWNSKQEDFPKLSKLAMAIHSIPASSTPSERAFSSSGSILTEKRTNLNPDCVEDMLLIRSDSEKFAENSIWNW